MIGEGPVRIKELRAGDVSAQRLQHLSSEKPSSAISGIYKDVHACQWLVMCFWVLHSVDTLSFISETMPLQRSVAMTC